MTYKVKYTVGAAECHQLLLNQTMYDTVVNHQTKKRHGMAARSGRGNHPALGESFRRKLQVSSGLFQDSLIRLKAGARASSHISTTQSTLAHERHTKCLLALRKCYALISPAVATRVSICAAFITCVGLERLRRCIRRIGGSGKCSTSAVGTLGRAISSRASASFLSQQMARGKPSLATYLSSHPGAHLPTAAVARFTGQHV